jgi:exosortase D (VPLPA-CTERM-specific)
LLSSALGVACLQVIGVTAFRDGNVIDLGPIQLQVVEACSGLRYFLPLTSLALLCAYLFQDRLWKRVVLFFSSVPLSILLNGFRIGVIGLLVDAYGRGAAEGFLHLFEGWVFFVVSLGALFVEMLLLSRVHPLISGRSWWPLVGPPGTPLIAAPPTRAEESRSGPLRPSRTSVVALGVLGLAAVASPLLAGRTEVVPARESFLDFPMVIGDWRGASLAMEKQYVERLRFDDYVLADYRKPGDSSVDVYIAYYRSQRKGQSAHSPKTCLPGGGWEITSLRAVEVGPALLVNRAVIQKGDERQLVYYWLKQRERVLTDEYLVKAFLFWDALTRQRTDGALVRLITAVRSEADETAADRRLLEFAKLVHPMLKRYVPD